MLSHCTWDSHDSWLIFHIASFTTLQVLVYSIGQAAVQHAVLRPLRGRHQDPPPSIAQQPAAQHAEEGPQTLSTRPREENETPASDTEVKHTRPASEEHSGKSDTKVDKTSGNTEKNEVNIMLAE